MASWVAAAGTTVWWLPKLATPTLPVLNPGVRSDGQLAGALVTPLEHPPEPVDDEVVPDVGPTPAVHVVRLNPPDDVGHLSG